MSDKMKKMKKKSYKTMTRRKRMKTKTMRRMIGAYDDVSYLVLDY